MVEGTRDAGCYRRYHNTAKLSYDDGVGVFVFEEGELLSSVVGLN